MPVFTAQSVNGFVEYLNECIYPTGKSLEISGLQPVDNDPLLDRKKTFNLDLLYCYTGVSVSVQVRLPRPPFVIHLTY